MTNLTIDKEMIKNIVVKSEIGKLLKEMKYEVIELKKLLPYIQE